LQILEINTTEDLLYKKPAFKEWKTPKIKDRPKSAQRPKASKS
jgi:hypothetical protein